MMERCDQVDVFLQPGDTFVADAQYRLRTLLGSCVAMTLWHRGAAIGGMTHFLLPERGGGPLGPGQPRDGRYGDEALALVLDEFRALGLAPTQCEAKVFGGGDMFPEQGREDLDSVGRRNGEAARLLLQRQGIALVSHSLFGIGHRQIVFDVATGDVWSHQVTPVLVADDASHLARVA